MLPRKCLKWEATRTTNHHSSCLTFWEAPDWNHLISQHYNNPAPSAKAEKILFGEKKIADKPLT